MSGDCSAMCDHILRYRPSLADSVDRVQFGFSCTLRHVFASKRGSRPVLATGSKRSGGDVSVRLREDADLTASATFLRENSESEVGPMARPVRFERDDERSEKRHSYESAGEVDTTSQVVARESAERTPTEESSHFIAEECRDIHICVMVNTCLSPGEQHNEQYHRFRTGNSSSKAKRWRLFIQSSAEPDWRDGRKQDTRRRHRDGR